MHRDLRATVVFGVVAFLKKGHISSSVVGRLIFDWIRRVVVATGSCDRSFPRDRSQIIPSRGATHVAVSCSASLADAYLSGANSSRKGHSIQRVVRTGSWLSRFGRIHGDIRVSLNGRDLKLRKAARIEQPLKNPVLLCSPGFSWLLVGTYLGITVRHWA